MNATVRTILAAMIAIALVMPVRASADDQEDLKQKIE